MAMAIKHELFTTTLLALIEESFEKVAGIYLDRGTSLFETMAGLSADEASRPVTETGTTIAAHVEHLRFYLRVMENYMDGQSADGLDWKQSWLRITVTPEEWDSLRRQLRDDHTRLMAHLKRFDDWNDERRIGGALGIVAHTAYHLGAIRQMQRLVKR